MKSKYKKTLGIICFITAIVILAYFPNWEIYRSVIYGHDVTTLLGEAGRVSSICFSPDGRYLVSGHEGIQVNVGSSQITHEKAIQLWSLEDGKVLHHKVYRDNGGDVYSVLFTKSGDKIIYSNRMLIRAIDINNPDKKEFFFHPYNCSLFPISLSPDGRLLAFGTND